MATFTQDEIDFLKAHGNDVCAKTWLGLWDPKRAVHQDQRELMIDKYERKRYYLEPASPLKSLTNATNLKTSSSSSTAGATTTTSTASSGSATSNNNRSNSNSTHNSSSNNNNHHHTHIQLTPPTSQRTTANGLHKSSSSAISRPHHSGNSTTTSQQNGFNTDAFGLHNGLNLSVGSASTGALSDTSSCASANGFGAEADFVADFGSADIFNATVASSSPASSVGSSSTNNINNGYAKIQQPLRSSGGATSAQQQFMNGNGNSFSSNGENFADFDHAPIYNAAGPNPLADIAEEPNYQFVRKNAVRKKSLRSESLTIKPNERQLKDILEMDNPMHYEDDGQQQQQDYIQFTPNESYLKATSDFNSIIEDFERFLTMNGHKYLDAGDQQQKGEQQAGGDFIAMMQAQQRQMTANTNTSTTKFTPLALAAHATAMAVLGNQNHFNTPAPPPPPSTTTSSNGSNLMTSKNTSLNAQWDVWSLDGSSNTTSMRSNQPQMATGPAAWQTTTSLFDIKEEQQQTQQSIGMSLFSSNSNNGGNILNPSNTTTSFFATGPSTSATTNLIPTTAMAATASSSASETKTGTSMLSNSNPFRMHLDVVCFDDDAALNLFNNNNNNNNSNNNFNSQSPYSASSVSCIATTKTNNNFDFIKNSNSNFDLFKDDVDENSFDNNNQFPHNNNNNKNPFSPPQTPPPTPPPPTEFSLPTNDPVPFAAATSNYYDPFSTDHILQQHPNLLSSSSTATATTTISLSPFSSPSSSSTTSKRPHKVVDFVDENANRIPQNLFNANSKTNYLNSKLEVAAASNNNKNNILNSNIPLSNLSNESQISSISSNTTSTINNYNSNSQLLNYHKNNDYNNNNNNNNDCWRLPMSNGITINKNSTTNGFNNNNNNNSNASTSPAAPAADRYAALKDLDEQLRESKAVAAQAASIVTANVVESGFGNPTNGTVNPFAAHNPAVANPFQSNGNAPNATQLFGQMTLIPNGMVANGFLNGQKAQVNAGFFNYTANGFATTNNNNNASNMNPTAVAATAATTPGVPGATTMYSTGIPNGCGFGFGTMHQQQIAATGAGLTANAFNNPFAASGALNSNNPFL
ncbi:myosin-G heavy chain isoform X2 [Musca domestica]|nr:myosin-G heavy chain isoform X2 [Musca domestica]